MATIEVKVVDNGMEVKRVLSKAASSVSHASLLEWFTKHADPYMRESFRKNFEESKAPEGDAWKKWSDKYRHHGNNLLRKSGGLMRSVTTKRGQIRIEFSGGQRTMTMAWGSNIDNIKYKIHQVGTNKAGSNNSVKIPARPMVGLRKEDRTYLGKSLGGWIARQMT